MPIAAAIPARPDNFILVDENLLSFFITWTINKHMMPTFARPSKKVFHGIYAKTTVVSARTPIALAKSNIAAPIR